MTTLLELKEKLVRFYGKYEVYITPIVKFIVAFAALMTIDRNICKSGTEDLCYNQGEKGKTYRSQG